MEMVRIAGSMTEDEFRSRPHMFTNINSSSPLSMTGRCRQGDARGAPRADGLHLALHACRRDGARHHCRRGDAQQNAEGLPVALPQQVQEGRALRLWRLHQQCRHEQARRPSARRNMSAPCRCAADGAAYGLPWRASNAQCLQRTDAQAIWESVFSLQSCRPCQHDLSRRRLDGRRAVGELRVRHRLRASSADHLH